MKLETSYEENLPSPNYKTRRFSRTMSETLPEDISKEDFLKRAERQQAVLEMLVKGDIERHVEEMKAKE